MKLFLATILLFPSIATAIDLNELKDILDQAAEEGLSETLAECDRQESFDQIQMRYGCDSETADVACELIEAELTGDAVDSYSGKVSFPQIQAMSLPRTVNAAYCLRAGTRAACHIDGSATKCRQKTWNSCETIYY